MLTKEDRDRFADYLEQSAKDGRGIIEQFEKLGPMHMLMVYKLKAECVAEEIVAAKLRSTRSMEL